VSQLRQVRLVARLWGAGDNDEGFGSVTATVTLRDKTERYTRCGTTETKGNVGDDDAAQLEAIQSNTEAEYD